VVSSKPTHRIQRRRHDRQRERDRATEGIEEVSGEREIKMKGRREKSSRGRGDGSEKKYGRVVEVSLGVK
jgi:hypothetical protein